MSEIKTNYDALISRCDDFERDILSDAMESFVNYVRSVYTMMVKLPIIRLHYDEDEVKDRIEELDRSRRLAHENAINACRLINRLCDAYDVDRYCPDTDDRYCVSDFCARISVEIFKEGTHSESLNSLVEELCEARKAV